MHGPYSAERDALLDAARGCADVVVREASDSERAGTLTRASVDALVAARLFRAFLPRGLGGLEADPLTLIEIVEEIARQDGSAGWNVGMGGIISGIAAALLPEAGARQVFADPDTICAGGFPPQGRARRQPGGHRIEGRFRFGSGCRHASWMVLTCLELEAGDPGQDDDAPAGMRSFCVPQQQVTIHDNWQVAGLEATASNDYSVADLFVPDSLSFSMGVAPSRGSALYRLPILSVAAAPHSGFALGLGAQALELVREHARGTQRLGSAARLADRAVFQNGFAQAATKLRAARGLALECFGNLWRAQTEARPITLEARAAAGAATTFAYQAAVEAGTFAFRSAGGGALYRSGRLQRCFRDIQAGAQHIVPSEESWERVGQVLLGVGTPAMI